MTTIKAIQSAVISFGFLVICFRGLSKSVFPTFQFSHNHTTAVVVVAATAAAAAVHDEINAVAGFHDGVLCCTYCTVLYYITGYIIILLF